VRRRGFLIVTEQHNNHGFDLAALQAHGHSIFGPSSSAMWLHCSGSLLPNLMCDDDAGEDAAYGTVGHECGEEWLKRIRAVSPLTVKFTELQIDEARPDDWIGQVRTVKGRHNSFEIEITEEMLAYVREYVEWCCDLPGEHYIETKVYFSDYTPIPNQGGTSDHAACQSQKLTISDLKMGKGVRVFAKWNTQGLLYALGFFLQYDWLYDFQQIEIRIAQPRLGHFDTWELTRDELLNFADWAKERAFAAWVPNAPRTPGEKQCTWCKVKTTCAARLAWLQDSAHRDTETDDVFQDETGVEIDEHGVITGVSYSVAEMKEATDRFLAGPDEFNGTDPGRLSTDALAKLLPFEKEVKKWFDGIRQELMNRANAGEEIPGHKVVAGKEGDRKWADAETVAEELGFLGLDAEETTISSVITPPKAEELLHKKYRLSKRVAASLIADLVTRSPGKDTLVRDTDVRKRVENGGDVFVDESGADED
jgi:hypothetical protein